ncbi:hypothetical protein [Virgibacillus sp. JSM 102003]|uniref:hypothetical protein n=1 Tax=Virgibacillus sp. JSM 102003 TaxID=1562108 RepID=UPI0035BFDA96
MGDNPSIIVVCFAELAAPDLPVDVPVAAVVVLAELAGLAVRQHQLGIEHFEALVQLAVIVAAPVAAVEDQHLQKLAVPLAALVEPVVQLVVTVAAVDFVVP